MTFSEILNILLGGGFITLVVSVITLKATVRKANADAERARADAESVRITNTDTATRILVENIVKPLKEELNATREDLRATKREMGRLRRALEAARDCPHTDYCPVLFRLRDYQKDELPGEYGEQCGAHVRELFPNRPQGCHGTGADEPGENGNIRGQPP